MASILKIDYLQERTANNGIFLLGELKTPSGQTIITPQGKVLGDLQLTANTTSLVLDSIDENTLGAGVTIQSKVVTNAVQTQDISSANVVTTNLTASDLTSVDGNFTNITSTNINATDVIISDDLEVNNVLVDGSLDVASFVNTQTNEYNFQTKAARFVDLNSPLATITGLTSNTITANTVTADIVSNIIAVDTFELNTQSSFLFNGKIQTNEIATNILSANTITASETLRVQTFEHSASFTAPFIFDTNPIQATKVLADQAEITSLSVGTFSATTVSFSSLNLDSLYTDYLSADDVLGVNATYTDITTTTLTVTTQVVDDLTATDAVVTNLTSTNSVLENIIANNITANNLSGISLNALEDVDVSNVSNSDGLIYNSQLGKWVVGKLELENEIITGDSVNANNVTANNITSSNYSGILLSMLEDVDTTNVENQNGLIYNSATGNWEVGFISSTGDILSEPVIDGGRISEFREFRQTINLGLLSTRASLGSSSADFVGMVSLFAMATPPDGWLMCDGTLLNRNQYIELFNAIGETWGAGDGSTTFAIPDLRSVAPNVNNIEYYIRYY